MCSLYRSIYIYIYQWLCIRQFLFFIPCMICITGIYQEKIAAIQTMYIESCFCCYYITPRKWHSCIKCCLVCKDEERKEIFPSFVFSIKNCIDQTTKFFFSSSVPLPRMFFSSIFMKAEYTWVHSLNLFILMGSVHDEAVALRPIIFWMQKTSHERFLSLHGGNCMLYFLFLSYQYLNNS